MCILEKAAYFELLVDAILANWEPLDTDFKNIALSEKIKLKTTAKLDLNIVINREFVLELFT